MEELRNILEDCYKNNESYLKTFDLSDGRHLMITKYPYTRYTMEILSEDKKQVLEKYDKLWPFDCYDLIREYMIML